MIEETQAAEGGEYSADDLVRIGRTWIERIEMAEKREDQWIRDAKAAETAYLADDDSEEGEVPRFNILHSNVETIVPSIYNSTPAPEIRPRHNMKDPVGKVVSDIYERAISTQIDDNRMDAEIEKLAQDAFMAGRGIVRVKFDADEVPAQVGVSRVYDPESGEEYEQEVEIAPARLVNERIVYENVSWRDYREGPAKRWRDVPWVAYRHEVSEEERERLEDRGITDKTKEKYEAVDEDKDCAVWEIWCKESQKVYFVVEDSSKLISMRDDPMGLTGFFPQAEPVQPVTGTGQRRPVCPYSIYKKLAEELDTATKRINAIMKGLKVRGAIAADAEAIEMLAQAGDNELVPVANIENLVAAGGLDRAVMWWPIETSIAVLQQLYVQREQVKQSIYEITGISDIIRGQGAASETATAQQIKTEWGSLRIKKMQRLIERQVRDLFVISAEIIGNLFSFEAIQEASGISIQAEENPQAVMQAISEPLDHYRIDVESDSTIKADKSKNRQQMSEFLQGTAQFFSTMQPIIGAAPQAAGPLAQMYSAFARQFSLGKSAEDALEQFTEMAEQASKKPKGPSPEEQAEMAEQKRKDAEFEHKIRMDQAEVQRKERELQLEIAAKSAELKLKGEQLNLDEAKANVDAAAKAYEIEMEDEQERPVRFGAA